MSILWIEMTDLSELIQVKIDWKKSASADDWHLATFKVCSSRRQDGSPEGGRREVHALLRSSDHAPRGLFDGRVASLRPQNDAHRRDRRDDDVETGTS